MIVASAVAAIALLLAGRYVFAGVAMVIALSTLWVRQILVPKINAHRDAEFAGDAEAGKRFERGHKLSVQINMAQLLATIVVMVLIA